MAAISHSKTCACQECRVFSLTEKAVLHGVKEVSEHYQISLKEAHDFLVKSGYIKISGSY